MIKFILIGVDVLVQANDIVSITTQDDKDFSLSVNMNQATNRVNWFKYAYKDKASRDKHLNAIYSQLGFNTEVKIEECSE